MGIFTKEVTTNTIQDYVDIRPKGLGSALVSLTKDKDDSGLIKLVVGAYYEKSIAGWFSKESLGNLIEALKEVHEIMTDK